MDMAGDRSSSSTHQPVVLERVTPDSLKLYAPRLASIICAHVVLNQSTHFLHPYNAAEAIDLFERSGPALMTGAAPGGVIMWIAKLPRGEIPLESLDKDGKATEYPEIVGSVQLAFHTTPNGRHRSEVRKLIVDHRYQRRGIARTLMEELEAEARRCGSTLCLLDTEEGYTAEKLYVSLGWTIVGYVPNYAMTPDGQEKRGAVYMYKELV